MVVKIKFTSNSTNVQKGLTKIDKYCLMFLKARLASSKLNHSYQSSSRFNSSERVVNLRTRFIIFYCLWHSLALRPFHLWRVGQVVQIFRCSDNDRNTYCLAFPRFNSLSWNLRPEYSKAGCWPLSKKESFEGILVPTYILYKTLVHVFLLNFKILFHIGK